MTESTTTDVAELRRIDFAAALWFGMTLIAAAIGLSGLVAAGWRSGVLAAGSAALWWTGAALVFGGITCLGWAGCPVLGATVHGTVRGKSVTVRAGLAVYLAGTAATAVVVILG